MLAGTARAPRGAFCPSRRSNIVLRLALLSIVITPCPAQTNTATINGVIGDSQRGTVLGSVVVAINHATEVRSAVTTNAAGLYSIPNRAIGSYTITVQKEGFRRYVHRGITLTTSQILELNVTLEVGEVNETVNVTAAEPLVN